MIFRICVFIAALIVALPVQADDFADCNQRTDLSLRIKACTTLLESGALPDSSRAGALTNRANALRISGAVDDALADYEIALQLRPDAQSFSNRASARFMLGDLQGAFADLSMAVEIDPNYADAHHNLGMIYAQTNDLEHARAAFTNALRSNPNVRGSLVARARINCDSRRTEASVQDYLAAISQGSLQHEDLQAYLVSKDFLTSVNPHKFGAIETLGLRRWILAACP